MGSIRIGLAQINTTVGDLEGNFKIIKDWIAKAKSQQVDLIIFPELALTGYPPEDLLFHSAFVEENLELIEWLVPFTSGISAMIGFVDSDENLRNAAAVISDGEWLGTYHKQLLPNYDVFDEMRYFEPGGHFLIATQAEFRIGVTICEDVWKAAPPVEVLAETGGANFLINLSASPYHAGKVHEREAMMSSRASKHGVYLAFCNLIGGQDELIFSGRSAVFGPNGDVIARAKAFEEDLLIVDIDDVVAPKLQEKELRANNISEINLGPFSINSQKQTIDRRIEEIYSYDEAIFHALILGTRDYFHKNGMNKALLGISGGIDSALVAAIAVEALGSENVEGVYMPSQFSSNESQEDAHRLARNLGMKISSIPIEGMFETSIATLSASFAGSTPDTTEENLQARIRGMILMALSNKFGSLVLTTGNKSEYSMGYSTLYGDMVGGLAVIKDLSKKLVYELAKWINRDSEVIPGRIITKSPTAELRDNQRDEDDLPAPYEELDQILLDYVEGEMSTEEISKSGHDREVVERVMRAVDQNEYKRRQSALGLRITPRAFEKDRRYPITNRYRSQSKSDKS
jgi:NAD+ synthase (glutamine-hydrolysing)